MGDKSPIGIVCALAQEVEGFLHYWDKGLYRSISLKRRNFYQGIIAGRETVIVESGWGKVRAASATQLLIDCFSPGVIINVGAAGAINPKRNIGDIILSESTLEYDFHSGEGGGQRPKKADDYLLQVALKANQIPPYQQRIFTGLIISGDQDINSRDKKEFLWKRYQAQCGEWEGAAVATVAKLNNLPWLLIRAISDLAEEDFAHQFEHHISLAARSSAEVTVRFLRELNNTSIK
jgi:adenosylhomocysteine nucleosidase